MIKRTHARESILQVLYTMESSGISLDEARENFSEHFRQKAKDEFYFQSVLEGVELEKKNLDARITPHLKKWKLSRLGRIDRCILRLACYELMYKNDLSVSIIIDEAVELGKKFGDEKTAHFINGVLDNIAREIGR